VQCSLEGEAARTPKAPDDGRLWLLRSSPDQFHGPPVHRARPPLPEAIEADSSTPGPLVTLDSRAMHRPLIDTHSPDEKARQRTVIVVLRSAFFILAVTVTLLNIIEVSNNPTNTGFGDIALATLWYLPVTVAVLLVGIFIAVDVLTPRKKIATLTGIAIGLIAGMVVTFAFAFVIDLIAQTWNLSDSPRIVGTFKILVGISLVYLGITTVLQTQDDFRLVIPYVEFSKQLRGIRPMLLDTSAIIDARILEAAMTGVLQAPLIIPQFVIDELQRLADSNDKLKRDRGRRGLDVVRKLLRSPIDVSVEEFAMPGNAVDTMLVELAMSMPAKIITTDSGLLRVAEIRGVETISLHALATAMRPSLIPGETFNVRIIRVGEQPGQGVGYLADGTMVVAEDGEHHVGNDVELTVITAIQTANGRMIFGRVGAEPLPPTHEQPDPETGPDPEEPESAPPSVDATPDEAAPPEAETPSADEPPPTSAPTSQRPLRPARPNRSRNPRR